MPGISATVAYISLGVTAALVAAGYGLPAVPIASVAVGTATSVQTAAPHNLVPGQSIHGAFAGLAGVTATNVHSSDAYGRPIVVSVTPAAGTFVATAVDATTLALSTLGPDGTVTPLATTGTYSGGGTYRTALVDGRIVLGRQHVAEQSYAPRVCFIPLASPFGVKSVSSASNVTGYPGAEPRRELAQRAIASETLRFEVHVWGAANPVDPEAGDFDVTQVLYQQVIMTTHLVSAGRYRLLQGAWVDQQPGATQMMKAGHQFVFGVEIDTPILDALLSFVPHGTVGQIAINLSGAPPGDATTINAVG